MKDISLNSLSCAHVSSAGLDIVELNFAKTSSVQPGHDTLPAIGSGDRAVLIRTWFGPAYVGARVVERMEFAQIICVEEVARLFSLEMAEEYVNAEILASLGPAHPPSELSFSVVVCTADRPESLRRCLASLAQLSSCVQDVVIVDNSQNEAAAVRALVAEFGYRYVLEEVPGLDRARNRGLLSVESDLVLFTDDDVEISADWDAWLRDGFIDPLVMVTTGLVIGAVLATESQLGSEVFCPHARGPFRTSFDWQGSASSVGVGASMAVRRQFVLGIGGFPEELDAGRVTGTGGDTWVFGEVLDRGYRAVYEPRSLVRHWHRESPEALEKMMCANAAGAWALVWRHLASGNTLRGLRLGRGTALWNAQTIMRVCVRKYPMNLALAELKGTVSSLSRFRAARKFLHTTEPLIPAKGDTSLLPAPWIPAVGQALIDTADGGATVNVVVPTRGRKKLVSSLVSTLLPLAGIDQIVVVVDGDIDGSVNALRELNVPEGRLRIVELYPDSAAPGYGSGAAAARNAGVAVATGDIVIFLDDDVRVVQPDFAVRHARLHARSSRVVGLGPALVDERDAVSHRNQRMRNWWVSHTQRLLAGTDLSWPDVCTGNLSIRREFFNKLAGFDERLPRREDWDFGMRACVGGGEIKSDYCAYIVHRPGAAEPFSEDWYHDGIADARIAKQSPEYGYQVLMSKNLRQFRSFPVFRMAFENPGLAIKSARSARTVLSRIPKILISRRLEALWYLVTYCAGRGAGRMPNNTKQEFFDYDKSLERQVVRLGEPFPFDLVASGAYFRYEYRGQELGALSTVQSCQASTKKEAGYRALALFRKPAAEVLRKA